MSISGEVASAAALDFNGTVWTWGNNQDGLGNGTTTQSEMPVAVVLPHRTVSLSARGRHAMALLEDGSVWSWGELRSARSAWNFDE